jgi:hypothetical protein
VNSNIQISKLKYPQKLQGIDHWLQVPIKLTIVFGDLNSRQSWPGLAIASPSRGTARINISPLERLNTEAEA